MKTYDVELGLDVRMYAYVRVEARNAAEAKRKALKANAAGDCIFENSCFETDLAEVVCALALEDGEASRG
jgi:hypothetical protein